jgi:hypothetical protein
MSLVRVAENMGGLSNSYHKDQIVEKLQPRCLAGAATHNHPQVAGRYADFC